MEVSVYLFVVSLAVWRHVTVIKGETLRLSCPVTDANMTPVDWKNPEGYIMFFNRQKGDFHIYFALITQQTCIISNLNCRSLFIYGY